MDATLTFSHDTATHAIQTSGQAKSSLSLYPEAYAGPSGARVGGRWTTPLASGSL